MPPKRKLATLKFDTQPAAKRNKPPVFALPTAPAKEQKGKDKAEHEDRLWVDIYEPTDESNLAVHKKKVDDVRGWFREAFDGGPSGQLRKYRRILALTGPAGTGKTSTIRVLAREMGFDILEWRNSVTENFAGDDVYDHESLTQKFNNFLTRASACSSVFNVTSASSSQSSSSQSTPAASKKIILLEDLPNILHAPTAASFHAALASLLHSSNPNAIPVVIIVSDAGTHGETSDERAINGQGWAGKEVVDVRSILGKELLGSGFVTKISFNPIAPTLLRKALLALLETHASRYPKPAKALSGAVDTIVETTNGDIRSAIMALQFASISVKSQPLLPTTNAKIKSNPRGKGKNNPVALLESITRREQSLALFHLMGRVLYNKRKGDPILSTFTAAQIKKDAAIDARFPDEPKLPRWWREQGETRRRSRVDADALYAQTPIDTPLYALYIHQNYPPFCDTVEECWGVSDWLSWVDSSGIGSASGTTNFNTTNITSFHTLTLGTLHSLPTPVTRRGQKFFKPDWFDVYKRTGEAWDAVGDVCGWLRSEGRSEGWSDESEGGRTWSRTEVAIDFGGVLKALDSLVVPSSSQQRSQFWSQSQPKSKGKPGRPPPSHRRFSHLPFVLTRSEGKQQLSEDDDVPEDAIPIGDELPEYSGAGEDEVLKHGGWLEGDDIEDF